MRGACWTAVLGIPPLVTKTPQLRETHDGGVLRCRADTARGQRDSHRGWSSSHEALASGSAPTLVTDLAATSKIQHNKTDPEWHRGEGLQKLQRTTTRPSVHACSSTHVPVPPAEEPTSQGAAVTMEGDGGQTPEQSGWRRRHWQSHGGRGHSRWVQSAAHREDVPPVGTSGNQSLFSRAVRTLRQLRGCWSVSRRLAKTTPRPKHSLLQSLKRKPAEPHGLLTRVSR